MPSRSDTKRAQLARWLAERAPERIDSTAFAEMRATLAPVSASYLRQLVRAAGLPMTPEVEGVVAASLPELRRTLLALAEVYAGGNKQVRALVIEAKDRLKWAQVRGDPAKQAEREEMILWTMTWLENPGAFEVWVGLREKVVHSPALPVFGPHG